MLSEPTFLRPVGCGGIEAAVIAHYAAEMARSGAKYDFRAIAGILWSIATRANCEAGREWKWYCTEHVREAHRRCGWDVWSKSMPTPLTTEKRILQGRLGIVASHNPEWDLGGRELAKHLERTANATA